MKPFGTLAVALVLFSGCSDEQPLYPDANNAPDDTSQVADVDTGESDTSSPEDNPLVD